MGTPDDAALGLPLVMTGPDSTRRLDALERIDGMNEAQGVIDELKAAIAKATGGAQ